MLTIAIAVFAYWLCLLIMWRRHEDRPDGGEMGMAFCFGGAIAAVFGLLITLPIYSFAAKSVDDTPAWTQQLVSLRSADGASGSFFLGSGRIDSELYYTWYERLRDGAIVSHRMVARGDVLVYEQDRIDAQLSGWHRHFTHAWVRWFALDMDEDIYVYTFYVPNGTVRQGFSL